MVANRYCNSFIWVRGKETMSELKQTAGVPDIHFKGTREGVLIVVSETSNFSIMMENLKERLRMTKGFFAGSDVTIDLGKRLLDSQELQSLEELMSENNMNLVQIVQGPMKEETKSGPVLRSFARVNQNRSSDRTYWVKKTLRSGQKVNFDGNVVVIGDVNPGAEIVASGDVVVFGVLKGVVHAGATGNDRAIVAAGGLRPIQLRIAQYITRAPDEKKDQKLEGISEIAYVKEEMIVVEHYYGFLRNR